MAPRAFPSLLRTLPTAVLTALLLGCGATTESAPRPDATPDTSTTDAVADTSSSDAAPDAPADASTSTDAAPPPDVAPADVVEPPLMSSSCDALMAGTVSNFMVDGMAREFILTLPSGATAPGGRWPVVFLWHGLGDTAPNFNPLLAGSVNNTTMPFILVTPESTHLGPLTSPPGLDWDELNIMTPNREARLFDAVLRCADMRWGVDRDRVYTVGFSAGAIMSDLLGVLRGDQLGAVVSFSGAYFSNPDNPSTLGILRSFLSWPPLSTRNPYAQMLISGGTTDTFNLMVSTARFNVFAMNDTPYLLAGHHPLVVCEHGMGHRVPAALARQVVPFLAAHPRGVARSPWATMLPAEVPSYCTFMQPGV